MKFIFILFLYPPLGHEANAIIVDKYATERACAANEKTLNEVMPTQQTKCVKLIKSDLN